MTTPMEQSPRSTTDPHDALVADLMRTYTTGRSIAADHRSVREMETCGPCAAFKDNLEQAIKDALATRYGEGYDQGLYDGRQEGWQRAMEAEHANEEEPR